MRSSGLFRRFAVVLLALVTAAVPRAALPDLPAGKVRVEILEGVPDVTNWEFDAPAASEMYEENAFGFAVMPTKYSEKGIKIDRAAPLVFRASALMQLPAGTHRILLRSRTGARLKIDDKIVVGTPFPDLRADGHEEVPEAPPEWGPTVRLAGPGHFDRLAEITSDGLVHVFTLEALIGSKNRRPELGELSVSINSGSDSFRLLSPALDVPLTDEGWMGYEKQQRAFWKSADAKRRNEIAREEKRYWDFRHERARHYVKQLPPIEARESGSPVSNDIDRFINSKLERAGTAPAILTDDLSFLRRVTLDITGRIPRLEEISAFLKDSPKDSPKSRRATAIDRLLQDPGWADHWVGYWQDVLAENPGIVKPMLNNTGPFRWWIYESFADNKAIDRFVTELVMMEGSLNYGGPAGFGLATQNDVPMAQKAQVIAQAFMAMQMQCARCHDAPYHHFKQKDLFSLAAMLRKEPQAVPLSSSIPTNANIVLGRLVNVTLAPGSKVEPHWPFAEILDDELEDGLLREKNNSREKLAALLTAPKNERFAKVIVNRLWKRYLGFGLIEPVDDWETARPSHPELLDYLARELTSNGYDLKHVARLILNSQVYQREATPEGSLEKKATERLLASAAKRRMTAEQLVDSLFLGVGKQFDSEEMNLDVDGRRPVNDFRNLGIPERAWQFTSLSNERDRPALSMPKAQPIVDTLTTFGWRESRQSPLSVRDDSPNVLQPALLANSVISVGRLTRLSGSSALTELCLQEQEVEELIEKVFLSLLTRKPGNSELAMFAEHLREGYATRVTHAEGSHSKRKLARAVSWSNHLNPEATRIKNELEKEARAGDPPTERLKPDWRERMEDFVWVLINSPEFVFLP